MTELRERVTLVDAYGMTTIYLHHAMQFDRLGVSELLRSDKKVRGESTALVDPCSMTGRRERVTLVDTYNILS